MNIRIDVVSDTVCPWCYVGKRTLDLVIADRPDLDFEVHWHPFQLNPDVPDAGVDRQTYWKEKFGDSDRMEAMVENLRERGSRIDIDFQFDRISVQPNTLRSHVLIALAAEHGVQHAVKESILAAFFEEGQDIGDIDVLAELGERSGLPRSKVIAALNDSELLDQTQAAAESARQAGITGVPSFIFNSRHLVPGAIEAPALASLIDQVVADTQASSAD